MQSIDKLLLKKFLDGNCNAAELIKVQELLQHPETDEILDQIIAEDAASDWKTWREQPIVQDNQMKGWQARFQDRAYTQKKTIIKTISKRNLNLLKYAAIWLVVIMGSGYFGLQYYKKSQQALPASYITVKSEKGHVIKFKLPDSTAVLMNAATKIKFAERFNGKSREVYLEGEAFFDVVHNKHKPFIIHTGGVKVQVLGTSFNVKAYRNDKDLSVTVATGKVGVLQEVQKQGKTYMLRPGDQLSLNKASGKFSNLKVNPGDISAWQSGTMVFNNETLESITHRLERWYNVSFVFKNKALPFTRFKLKQKNEHLQTIMNALSASGGFHYKIDSANVTVW